LHPTATNATPADNATEVPRLNQIHLIDAPKFTTRANYNLRLAVVGDISRHLAASKSLHDFVFEANRGHSIWFVENMDDLERRLARQAA